MTTPSSVAYRPLSIIRLWSEHHTDEALWKQVLAMLRRRRGACDEIWFATLENYPSLDAHRRCAEKLKRAVAQARDAGFLPGLQFANTLGHSDRPMFDNSGAADFQVIVGHNGTRARTCFCPRGPRLRDYFRRVAALYAESRPSSAWIDDDLRMHWHSPVEYGCFCDACLTAFAERAGREWTREGLVQALHDPLNGSVRLAWTKFNESSMAELAGAMAEAVHETAPDCVMGIQNCGFDWSLYNGRNYDAVFAAMHRATGLSVGHRPGAGHYHDAAPRPMIDKAFLLARSAAMQPESVGTTTAEIENWPHVALGKTPQGTAVEASLYLAHGCNSVSFALLCNDYEPMERYERVVARLEQWRPFWERFLSGTAGTRPGGLYVALSDRHVGRALEAGERPFAWGKVDLTEAYQMSCIGLPLTADPKCAAAVLLHGRAVPGYTDDELKALLAGGVLMDGAAAYAIQKRGLGALLGLDVRPFERRDCRERFTSDPLNGTDSGGSWRWTTLGGPTGRDYQLTLAPGGRETACYENPAEQRVGTATALTENAAGGRLAVFGRNPWNTVVSGALRNQLLRAADWVAGGRLPVLAESVEQAAVVPRVTANGELRGVFVLNVSIDETPATMLTLRNFTGTYAAWLVPNAAPRRLKIFEAPVGRRVELPALPPWTPGVLLPPEAAAGE